MDWGPFRLQGSYAFQYSGLGLFDGNHSQGIENPAPIGKAGLLGLISAGEKGSSGLPFQ